MLYYCFPFGSLASSYVLGKGYLSAQPRIKTLGTEFLMNFLGRQHVMCVVTHNSLLEELNVFCVTPLGENPWMIVLALLWTSHFPY